MDGRADGGGIDIPVLIAGGGPVGLALATELGLRGVACLLAEKRDGRLPVPKMSQVSTRNMEFCRRWGIAEAVRNAAWSGTHALDFVYLTSLTGFELARQKVPSYATRGNLAYSPEGPCHCPQIYFDPILAARARSLPGVTLRYDTALTGFTQDAAAVRATLTDSGTGERKTVTARYLVGCDGPGGTVRETLGIALGGLGTLATSVNIFFRSPGLASLHDKGWARFYRLIDETGSWGELIAIDGRELWRLTVFDDAAAAADPDAFLRRCAGTGFAYEIISAMPWERRDYVAERYRAGRVFIAGDAAHQCSPTGGLGMHTGVEEAVNLAWKIEAALDGWGGARLLDSYEAERRPVALRNVELSTRSYRNIAAIPAYKGISEPGPEGARVRAAFGPQMEDIWRYSVVDHHKVQYPYEGSPICVADGTPAPEEGVRYVPSARPGTRAPHAWIADGKSTVDLFGDGFVVLRLGPEPPDAGPLIAAARERGVPIREEALADGEIAGIYGRKLVLVRPDGHVAWRGPACPADAVAVIDRVRGAV